MYTLLKVERKNQTNNETFFAMFYFINNMRKN